GENSETVARRGDKLGAKVCLGVKDKLEVALALIEERGLTLDQCACIGDDVNDLELLRAVGLSACPADAMLEVREAVNLVCGRRGGDGAFREFAEMILAVHHSARPLPGQPQGEVHAAHSRAS